MDDTDLSALDPAAAREYVHGFATSLRLTVKRRQQLETERQTWEERVRRAAAAGDDRLRDAARERLRRVQEDCGRVAAEEAELQAQVEVLQRQLRRIRATAGTTVDAEQLLVQIQEMVGDPDTLQEDLDRLSAEQRAATELESLKRRNGARNGSPHTTAATHIGSRTGVAPIQRPGRTAASAPPRSTRATAPRVWPFDSASGSSTIRSASQPG